MSYTTEQTRLAKHVVDSIWGESQEEKHRCEPHPGDAQGAPQVVAGETAGPEAGAPARLENGEGQQALHQQWQGRATTFMRSNEHTRDRKQRWDPSLVQGTALCFVEGDRDAPKCARPPLLPVLGSCAEPDKLKPFLALCQAFFPLSGFLPSVELPPSVDLSPLH
jgi:hypothetical protein